MSLREKIKDSFRLEKVGIEFKLPLMKLGIDFKGTEEEKREFLRELYEMRYKLSYFASLQVAADYYYRMRDEEDLISGKLINQAMDTYSHVANLLFSSKYFVSLKREQREDFIEKFDFVTEKNAAMDIDQDEDIDPDEMDTIIAALLGLFDNIEEEIATFSN